MVLLREALQLWASAIHSRLLADLPAVLAEKVYKPTVYLSSRTL